VYRAVKSAGKRQRIPHVDDPALVGRRLAAAREAAMLSQRDIAFPGCSAAYISRIEHGERTPSLQVLRELADRCGVSEAYLAWGRDPRVDPAIWTLVTAVQEAESSGSDADRAAAYAALGRAATRVARSLVS
jgi:transcriptional regulator with XRE-family HTH domain